MGAAAAFGAGQAGAMYILNQGVTTQGCIITAILAWIIRSLFSSNPVAAPSRTPPMSPTALLPSSLAQPTKAPTLPRSGGVIIDGTSKALLVSHCSIQVHTTRFHCFNSITCAFVSFFITHPTLQTLEIDAT
ncbi:hypothetical protein DL98DRAFT_300643 [Cadophora sp. DSE1049]|nr:hypothetical protein DL98DRAFT_300643 [Cadophora sp. DSE1049]